MPRIADAELQDWGELIAEVKQLRAVEKAARELAEQFVWIDYDESNRLSDDDKWALGRLFDILAELDKEATNV